ncbi:MULTISPECIES: HEAT repeat domain-containing protein [Prochlorococcus]|uniref:HEAT-like repeat containing protein n=1 Tax=Prochlorococcus marinus (strain SARG / CCMP1375 / SS120) TaxID=167539 RepID=Q7TV91_PROMA|nr:MULTISPECIES: HEAT repeat domain-containing protein [Prochlorococcus]AAQ00678.1 HEAT-like repeat containing protein [Prochlorococcus marinus subsp. marinus str. CCMP1375]KGG10828.1 HEAT repeat [Prochlorococcus marinus str. LG]KGG20407.1 HEAT repeat [Prochlorococcus marinus str. SS2]KGG24076.1 HEAT repeat [Prochlorococcus marinus str. SS35]KGG31665.1 HEAT repeat [Prochlorococcus marinus str. SS51]
MKEDRLNSADEGLRSLAIDPDILAKELAAEVQGDPLDEIDIEAFDSDETKVSNECQLGLNWLQQGHEERLQGLRVFCEHRDPRSIDLLIPLLAEPCPVERMSAVYALGRNPSPLAVDTLLQLLENDSNAYVRKAAAWSLGNYSNSPVMEPLLRSLHTDVAAVRLWAASSLAEVGSSSIEKAKKVVLELLLSLRIDQEPLVRSNCIWSLGRLYGNLPQSLKSELTEGLFLVLLNDLEPSVRYEARIALEQIQSPDVLKRLKTLVEDGLLL